MEKSDFEIPYGRQDISQVDIDAVADVLRSDFLTQGPAVVKFEQAVATYCGVQHAVSANSATSALHLACLALGLGSGDRLWTSPITFVASANVGLYCGADVDFVDIDPLTYNMSVDCLEEKLVAAEIEGKLPKVVMPVHLCGQSCDMARIYDLSQQYGFKIIEDAAHAIGGKYKEEPIGSCHYSDVTVFSFHPVKIITSGEGGMVLSNSSELAQRMSELHSHGITRNTAAMKARPEDEIWNYQQTELGFNYRMTDMQAALGSSQLARLDEFVQERHNIACSYEEQLDGLPVELPWQHPDTWSSYHLYPIRIREAEAGKTQKQIYASFWNAQIKVNLHYIPVYRQPYYEAMGFVAGYCPAAEDYFKEAISLPMFPTLSDANLERVVAVLKEALT